MSFTFTARPTLLACLLAAVIPSSLRAQQVKRPPDDEAVQRARAEYFLQQRRYPFDHIPAHAYQRAAESLQPRFSVRSDAASTGGGASKWRAIGPERILGGGTPWAGLVRTIAVSPVDPNTIYIGASSGGVWKSTDGGTSWASVLDGQCSMHIPNLAIDPSNPNTIYAGTGDQVYFYGCGLLRSTDGGATWTDIAPPTFTSAWDGQSVTVDEIALIPNGAGRPATLVIRTSGGIYKSADGGANWTHPLTTGWYYPVTGLVVDPNDPQVMYAAATDLYATNSAYTGIFKSVDGGDSWARLATSPLVNGKAMLAISHSSPAVLYAAVIGPDGAGLGIWTSSDGGASWTQRAGPGPELASGTVLAVDPGHANVLYAGAVQLYRSVDSARTFTPIGLTMHVDVRGFHFPPGSTGQELYTGTDGGLYRTTDGGATWQDLNTNMVLTEFYPGISIERGNPAHVLGGSQDNGIDEYLGSSAWTLASGGDGGFTAIDYNSPSTVYGEVQWAPNSGYSGPERRVGTDFFRPMVSGIDVFDRAIFIPPFIMDQVNPKVLYFGTYRLYRTRDGTESWTALSGDLTKGQGALSAIAVSPIDTLTIWVGTSDGNVQVTRDGGATWTMATTGLPDRYVTDIAPDPEDANTAYVTVSGFQSGHVFRTQDGGQSWTDISGNLPDAPVSAVILIPGIEELFAGTDFGVFSSGRTGGSWSPETSGISRFIVVDLAYDAPTGTLVAATHGRGMFMTSLSSTLALRGDVSRDGNVSAVDAQAILRGAIGIAPPSGYVVTPNGDANCDGAVNALDAQIVLSKVVGLDVKQFCIGTFR